VVQEEEEGKGREVASMSEATDASKAKDEENKEVAVVAVPPQLAVVEKKHPLEHAWSFW
jgi:hypothetical protein